MLYLFCLQVDQAALTGESLPVKKYTNDVCFSGSTIKQGEKEAVVYATGANTFFGRAAALIGATNNVANLQKIMTKIGGTCLVTIGVWMVIEIAVQFGHYRHACAGGESEFSSAVFAKHAIVAELAGMSIYLYEVQTYKFISVNILCFCWHMSDSAAHVYLCNSLVCRPGRSNAVLRVQDLSSCCFVQTGAPR